MTAGVFMMFQNIKIGTGLMRVFNELSIFSYGIFLVHYIICLWVTYWLHGELKINLGVEQFLLALFIFLISYSIVKLISLVPKSKYLIG
jgi:surface polysaccharide O-acyltransferase-like enzyme